MIEFIYQTLAKIGYTHPLHPPATHLPAGLIIGAFVFALIAWIFNRSNLAKTAHHCLILALIATVPTIVLGLLDWQYRLDGTWLFAIKMKLALAGILLLLLILAVVYGALAEGFSKTIVAVYTLCLVTVIGLGFFGGELVYGTRAPAGEEVKGLAAEGALVFSQNCSACHHTDSTATKVGPGLKGIDDNFRQILKTPFSKMPPFGHLADEKVEALLDYLKTL
jgi:uncharacterized membrane protein